MLFNFLPIDARNAITKKRSPLLFAILTVAVVVLANEGISVVVDENEVVSVLTDFNVD